MINMKLALILVTIFSIFIFSGIAMATSCPTDKYGNNSEASCPNCDLVSDANNIVWTGSTVNISEATYSIKDSINYTYYWNATSESWSSWSPNYPEWMFDLKKLTQGECYYFNMKTSATWNFATSCPIDKYGDNPQASCSDCNLTVPATNVVWVGPDTPIDTATSSIKDSINYVYYWNSTSSSWYSYDPALPIEYSTIQTLTQDQCYYFNMKNNEYWSLMYNYWFGSNNCTAVRDTSGSLTCSASLDIPSDCIDVTSGSMSVSSVENEHGMNNSGAYYSLWYQFGWKPCLFPFRCIYTYPVFFTWLNVGIQYINTTLSFTKEACNPQPLGGISCSVFYGSCSYVNLNHAVYSYSADYHGGDTATAEFALVMPPRCVVEFPDQNATIKLIGRIWATCYSIRESGVHIDEGNETCNAITQCFNSNTLEIIDSNCTIHRSGCTGGCDNGTCSQLTTSPTLEPTEPEMNSTPMADIASGLPEEAQWVSFFLTPPIIMSIVVFGIAGTIASKIGGSKKGVIFLVSAIVIFFVLTITGTLPKWILIVIGLFAFVLISATIKKGEVGGD